MSDHAIIEHPALCLIIGDPVAHSLSPTMHNAAYTALNLPFVMAAARVDACALSQAIQGMRALHIKGLAVTMPHKVAIMDFIDSIDQTAETIGAINTVVNQNGSLVGYNTDWLGILRPLERASPLEGKKVAILGAGGAAQAAIFACQYAKASVTIFNRTIETAEALAQRFQCSAQSISDANTLPDFDIIINTTSLGMSDTKEQSPIPREALRPHHIVFETIYAPSVTTLLKDAQVVGAKFIPGSEMFLEQGIAQFELHTGVTAPREVMENITSSALRT